MRCRYCGYEIPDGEMYCRKCGRELRIVPDYNPLDDMLTEQIKVSINNEEDEYDDFYDTGTVKGPKNRKPSGRQINGRKASSGRRPTNGRRQTVRSGQNTPSDRERRRRQAEKKRAAKRRKRRQVLAVMLLFLILIIVAVFFIYRSSYNGLVSRGNKALAAKEYSEAEELFNKAINKKPQKAEAYTGLSKVYSGEDNIEKAKAVFLTAIDSQPDNSDLYEACILFYLDTEQPEEIPYLLEDAGDTVRKDLNGYIVKEPEFSLDEEKTYDDVQTLTLTAEKGTTIYYTDDGTDPSTKSTVFEDNIQISEGSTTITAIAVNEKGIPSLPAKKEFTVELPIVDAPAVSPSTGQYDEATKIEIKVPDGYEAYYTTDKSDPTTASKKYTGPIDMPEGTTIFKAILVNSKGRTSGITTRNYELVLE